MTRIEICAADTVMRLIKIMKLDGRIPIKHSSELKRLLVTIRRPFILLNLQQQDLLIDLLSLFRIVTGKTDTVKLHIRMLSMILNLSFPQFLLSIPMNYKA